MAAGSKTQVRSETLAEFAASLDEHAGTQVGFVEMVRELWQTRSVIKELAAARSALFDKIKAAHAEGARQVGDTGYELRSTSPSGETMTYRAVTSEACKRANVAAWTAAQVPVKFVQVKAPGTEQVPLDDATEAAAMIKATAARLPLDKAVLAYKEHTAWQRLRDLKKAEVDAQDRLEKLAAEFGWNGLPITFADGWTVGLKRRQYSSEYLAESNPEMFARLAVWKTRTLMPHVIVAKIAADNDEIDEFDGE